MACGSEQSLSKCITWQPFSERLLERGECYKEESQSGQGYSTYSVGFKTALARQKHLVCVVRTVATTATSRLLS